MQGVYQVEEGGGFLFFHGEEHNVIDSQQTGMYNPVVGHHCGGGQFLHFQACHRVRLLVLQKVVDENGTSVTIKEWRRQCNY